MSIFNTTANTSFNAFDDPLNSVNTNGPGWGMDQNYITPAFTAGYRPPYMGGQPHIAWQNPGFFRSLYGLSPMNWQGTPYGVGGSQQDDTYWSQMGNRPMDFGASFGQRIAAPLAAYGGAFAMSRAWQVRNQSRGAYDWFRMFGAGRAQAMNVSGFTAMGQRFGGGIARGMIAGASTFAPSIASSGLARAAAYGASALGGAAASIALPAMLAQGAISSFDSLVSDNYTGIRENQNLLRSAFRGVTFDGNNGDPYTGQGLSRRAAGRMGTELTQFGARDQVFNSREISSMTGMASQMGLLDNVSGDQITTRMKSLVQQIKIVMSVAQTTDFKEAMQMMAKLQMGGVNPGNLASTMGAIGAFSSAAGISPTRMFNTVGAQGQYLFQANGLTPYLGQLTAANSMAGMAAGFRTGLISPEVMARMGGVEGATQSSVTGQLNAAQTPYNMMRGFNRYTSGMGGSGVIQNVANFGRAFANDPLGAFGALQRTGPGNISRMLRDEGPGAVYSQLLDIADVNPMTAGRKISGNQTFALLMQMGMSREGAQAYMAQLGGMVDPATNRQVSAGFRSNEINMTRDWLEQTEQTRFKSMAPVRMATNLWRSASSGIAGMMGGGISGAGGFVDQLSAAWNRTNIGDPNQLVGSRVSDLNTEQLAMPITSAMFAKSSGISGLREASSFNRSLSEHRTDIEKIKEMASAGNTRAIQALRGDKTAIHLLASQGQISDRYRTLEDSDALSNLIQSLPKEAPATVGQLGSMEKALNDSTRFGGSALDKAEGFQAAFEIQKRIKNDTNSLTNPDAGMQGLMGTLRSRSGKSLADPREISLFSAAAVGESLDKGISLSNDYSGRKDGESFGDFMKRVNGVVENPVAHRNSNVGDEQKVTFQMRREEVRRQETMRRNLTERLTKDGRLDLAASNEWLGVAEKFDRVVDKFSTAVDNMPKEVTVGQNTSDSNKQKFGQERGFFDQMFFNKSSRN